jgi:hypothetical protein
MKRQNGKEQEKKRNNQWHSRASEPKVKKNSFKRKKEKNKTEKKNKGKQ